MIDRTLLGRRLAMPLLAVLVAAALMVWTSRRGAQAPPVADRPPEVLRLAEDLCADLKLGRDPGPHLAGADPMIASRLGPLLRDLGQRTRGAEALRVTVAPGDWVGAGSAAGQATHTASVFLEGREVLGLRLAARAGGGPVAIIGFWTPDPP
jgi:hypothetical protein